MNEWEIRLCRENTEINEQRLRLVRYMDKVLWENRTRMKFLNKEELDNVEKVFIKNWLESFINLGEKTR